MILPVKKVKVREGRSTSKWKIIVQSEKCGLEICISQGCVSVKVQVNV